MTLLIIDGDVLAYRACEPRWKDKIKKLPDGTMSEPERDENGHLKPLEFTKEEDRKYMEQSWDKFEKLIRDICDMYYTDQYIMAVKGGEPNYRDMLNPNYKIQRKSSREDLRRFVISIRKMAVKMGMALEASGREADDYVRIWALQAKEAGDDYVIVTIDKDLDCIPGRHYNPKTGEQFVVSEQYALNMFYHQMIMGDHVDKIPGVPGLGPKAVKDLFSGITKEEDMQEIVVSQYMTAYGDDWMSWMLSNAKMLHIQKNTGDYFSCQHWPVIKELT